jgi:hypothetical protein
VLERKDLAAAGGANRGDEDGERPTSSTDGERPASSVPSMSGATRRRPASPTRNAREEERF